MSKSELEQRSQIQKEMSLGKRNNEIRVAGKSEPPTRKFRVRRVKVGKVENKKKLKPEPPSCLCPLHHNFASFSGDHPLISSTKHHRVFLYLMPLLIALLQVDYQSKKISPFHTHKINMWGFIAATCIYCVGLGLGTNLESQTHPTTCSEMVSHVILSSGALASVSLASVLLPGFIGWLLLCLWTVLTITLFRNLPKHIYEWFKPGIKNAIDMVGQVKFTGLWECLKLKEQQLPITNSAV